MWNLLGATTPWKMPSMFTWQGFFAKVFNLPATANIPDAITEASSATDKALYKSYQAWLAADQAVSIIETALWIIIGIAGLAAVVYAIYLGIELAKASEQGKRDDAKKHLITVIIAIVVTLVLVIFALYLLPGILSAFQGTKLD